MFFTTVEIGITVYIFVVQLSFGTKKVEINSFFVFFIRICY